MKLKRTFPHPITILLMVIVLAAIATWLIPAGEYNKLSVVDKQFVVQTKDGNVTLPFKQQTLNSLHIQIPLEKFANGDILKPISIPDTYTRKEKKSASIINVLQAPIKGIYESIDIILLTLVMGGFIGIFNDSKALFKGVSYLAHKLKGKEFILIIVLTTLFAIGGSSFGMAEETLIFYPVLVPLFLAAGYDLLVPAAIIFGGSQLGTLSSFSNPFSTIIASNAAGINWADGINERIILFVVTTSLLNWYILKYAKKVKANPNNSLVYKIDGIVKPLYEIMESISHTTPKLETKTKWMLLIFGASFLTMIVGVIFYKWWLLEMTSLFLGSSLLVVFVTKMKEKIFIEQFIKGAESLLSVAFIIGVARGVTIVLNEGNISDSILHYTTQLIGNLPPAIFIIILLLLYMLFTLFISSSSGMAVLTMPILGALAFIVHVPGKEVVNSYLAGMGIMGFVTPTGLILPSLALVNVSLKVWMKFITPFLLLLFVVCVAFLLISLYAK